MTKIFTYWQLLNSEPFRKRPTSHHDPSSWVVWHIRLSACNAECGWCIL